MPEARNATMAGISVSVTQPYEEGQTINAAEAKALNQVRIEGIGNNMRSKLQELLKQDGMADAEGNPTAEAQAAAQRLVDEYSQTYQINVSNRGTGTGASTLSPEEREARAIAREAVTAGIKKSGRKVKEIDKEKLAAKIAEVAAHPDVVAEARKRLKARSKALDGLEISI